MTFEPEPPSSPRDISSRAISAALLDRRTFRDISEDTFASAQVYALVGAAAIASAIGSIDEPGEAVSNAVLVVAGWAIYAHVAWFMRTFLFDSVYAEAGRQEMLRVVGISYGPALLRVFAIVPGIGGVIWLASTIWLLVAIAVGLKTTLAFENYWPAAGILVAGIILNTTLSAIVFAFV